MARQVVTVPRRPRASANQARDIILAGQAISQSLAQASNSILAFREAKTKERLQRVQTLLGAAKLMGGPDKLPPQGRNDLASGIGLTDLPKDSEGGAIFPVPAMLQIERMTNARKLDLFERAKAGDSEATKQLEIMEGTRLPDLSESQFELERLRGQIATQRSILEKNLDFERARFTAITSAVSAEKTATIGAKSRREAALIGAISREDITKLDLQGREAVAKLDAESREEVARIGAESRQRVALFAATGGKKVGSQPSGFSRVATPDGQFRLLSTEEAQRRGLTHEPLTFDQAQKTGLITAKIAETDLDIIKSAEAQVNLVNAINGPEAGQMLLDITRLKALDPAGADEAIEQFIPTILTDLASKGTDLDAVDPEEVFNPSFLSFFGFGLDEDTADRLVDAFERGKEAHKVKQSILQKASSRLQGTRLPTERSFTDPGTTTTPSGVALEDEVDRLIKQGIEQGLSVQQIAGQFELMGNTEASEIFRKRISETAGDILRTNPPAP